MQQRFRALASTVSAEERPDRYGGGDMLEAFEEQIAVLLGKEAAVFMPSGTMAQQIALRIHAEDSVNDRVALHPQSHLVVAEEDAYQQLSGLRGIQLGERNRLFALDDLRAAREPFGSILIELPERNIGGALRSWEELHQLCAWARDHCVRLHMDGARLWESQPFYGRSHADISALFDSVYVSFYKGLDAIAGAALAGEKAFVERARLWQHRHGGRMVQLFPFVISARDGLKRYLKRMPDYVRRAREIARIIRDVGLTVTPDPPPTNMMHVYLRGDAKIFDATMVELARDRKIRLFNSLRATDTPSVHMFELNVAEAAFAISNQEIEEMFSRLAG